MKFMSNVKESNDFKKPLSRFLSKYEGKSDRTGSIAFDNDLKERLGLICNHLNVNQKSLLENIIEDWLDRYKIELEKEMKKKIKEFLKLSKL